MNTAVWAGIALAFLGGLLSALLFRLPRVYARGVRDGVRQTEIAHGWAPRQPIRHRRRRDWPRRNRQREPESQDPAPRIVSYY